MDLKRLYAGRPDAAAATPQSSDCDTTPLDLSKKTTAADEKRDENEPLDLSKKPTDESDVPEGGDDDVIVVGVQRPRGVNRSLDRGMDPQTAHAYRQGRQAAVYSSIKKDSYTGGVAFSPYEISTGLVKLKQALLIAKDPQQAKQLAHNFQRLALQTLLKSRLQQQTRPVKESTQSSSTVITGDKSSPSPAMGTLIGEPSVAVGPQLNVLSQESTQSTSSTSEEGMVSQKIAQMSPVAQAGLIGTPQGNTNLPSPREFGPSLPATVVGPAANYANQSSPGASGNNVPDGLDLPVPRDDLPESYQSKYMEYVRKKKFMSGGAAVDTPPPLDIPPSASQSTHPGVINIMPETTPVAGPSASASRPDMNQRKMVYKELLNVAKYAQRLAAQDQNISNFLKKKQLATQMQMVRTPPPAHCKIPPPVDGKRSYILPGAGQWYPNNVLVNNPRQVATALQRQRLDLCQDRHRKGSSSDSRGFSPRQDLSGRLPQQQKEQNKRRDFKAMRAQLLGPLLQGGASNETSNVDIQQKTEPSKQHIQNTQSLSGGSVSTPVLISGGFTGNVKSSERPANTVTSPPFSLSPHPGTVVKPVTPQFTGWNSGQYKRVPVANVNPIIHTTPDGITTITHHVTPQQYAQTQGKVRHQVQVQKPIPILPAEPKPKSRSRPSSRNSVKDPKEDLYLQKTEQDSNFVGKTEVTSDLSENILQANARPLHTTAILPLNVPSVDVKTDEIKAILRSNLDNSALAKKIQEHCSTGDDAIKTEILEDTKLVNKIRKKKKLKNKGVNFNSEDELTQKLKVEAEMLEKSEEMGENGEDIKPIKLGKKVVKRKKRKKSELIDDIPIDGILDGNRGLESVLASKKRRKAKDKGSRSARQTLRYNKNAKYEQELIRDEERKLINRVKRVARKRSSQSDLLESPDESSQDDITSDGFTSVLSSQSTSVTAANVESSGTSNKTPLRKLQLKLKRRGIWKRTKDLKSQLGGVAMDTIETDSIELKGGKKLRRRKRKRWYKKRKPLQFYIPQYTVYNDETETAFYTSELQDPNLSLPPPLEDIYEGDSEIYAHAPSIDPQLVAELKTIVVCRETGETKLHRLTRMGHEDLAERCIVAGVFDVNVRDHAGYTALHESCATGRFRVAVALIKHGADPNSAALDGTRPIHDAVDHNRIEMVRLLLSAGADPRLATYSGKTLMRIARTEDMRKLLIGYSQDINGVTVGEDLEPWDFGIPVPPSECRGGLDILADVPSDSESECNDLEFELFEDTPKQCTRLYLDPDVGPRNYHLVQDLAPAKGLTIDDFQILNSDLTFVTIPKQNALEYATLCSEDDFVKDIDTIFGSDPENAIAFVENNPTLHMVMEDDVSSIPFLKPSRRKRSFTAVKEPKNAVQKLNFDKFRKHPIKIREITPSKVTPITIMPRSSNEQTQLKLSKKDPVTNTEESKSKLDTREPLKKKKKKHKEIIEPLDEEQEWLNNTVDKFCKNAKYKKKLSEASSSKTTKSKHSAESGADSDKHSKRFPKLEPECSSQNANDANGSDSIKTENKVKNETAKNNDTSSDDKTDDKEDSLQASMQKNKTGEKWNDLNKNNSPSSSRTRSSNAKEDSSNNSMDLSKQVENPPQMDDLSCEVKNEAKYEACQYSPPPITCSVKGYKQNK